MPTLGFTRRRCAGIGSVLLAVCLLGMVLGTLAADPPMRSPIRDGGHVFQKRVSSWKELRDQNIVMQKRDFSCGAAALATVLQYYWGDRVTEHQILKQFDDLFSSADTLDRIKNGLSITDLRRAAVKLGYRATIGTLRFDQLAQSKVPLIVGITVGEFNHFVVYRGTDGYYVYLADPARGNLRTPVSEFLSQWQKNAALVVAKPGREPQDVSALSVRPEEIYQGELNRVEVQKRLARPAVSPPRHRP